jgi:hypothetical protein
MSSARPTADSLPRAGGDVMSGMLADLHAGIDHHERSVQQAFSITQRVKGGRS